MATASRYVPELRPGDRLSVEEFERRYDAMPDLKKAELLEGVVYMPSPVTIEDHAGPHFNLVTWLGVYKAHTPGTQGGDNATLRLLQGANRPQPNICLRIEENAGGQSTTEDRYVKGAPELVCEVAASSASYDLHVKLDVYRRNDVLEYLVWRVEDEAIDWFALRGGKYVALKPKEGVHRSKVFPGLWLDAAALIGGDLARVLQVVQQGIASPEHERFVKKLQRKRR